MWTPPSNLDAIDGYDVLISRRATDRAYGDHTGDHVITTVPGVSTESCIICIIIDGMFYCHTIRSS